MGVGGEDRFPSREGAYVARLARVQIIGEARPEQFWTVDESTRNQLIATFAYAGATALFTYNPPHIDSGWQRLAGTNYYMHPIGANQKPAAIEEKQP